MRYRELIETAGPVVLYHITSKPRFKLDPNYAPEDNAFAMTDRSGHKGIYLSKDVERWVNGHGYIRAFVAEIHAEPSALEHDTIGRYGGEIFVPADQFDKLKVVRVIPLDAYAREKYGSHGWLEDSHGFEFDTGNPIKQTGNYTPFRGYRYEGDVRTMTADEIKVLKQRAAKGIKARQRG